MRYTMIAGFLLFLGVSIQAEELTRPDRFDRFNESTGLVRNLGGSTGTPIEFSYLVKIKIDPACRVVNSVSDVNAVMFDQASYEEFVEEFLKCSENAYLIVQRIGVDSHEIVLPTLDAIKVGNKANHYRSVAVEF